MDLKGGSQRTEVRHSLPAVVGRIRPLADQRSDVSRQREKNSEGGLRCRQRACSRKLWQWVILVSLDSKKPR